MTTAFPADPTIMKIKKKDMKCKYIIYIVEINIWSREISLGGVENAGVMRRVALPSIVCVLYS